MMQCDFIIHYLVLHGSCSYNKYATTNNGSAYERNQIGSTCTVFYSQILSWLVHDKQSLKTLLIMALDTKKYQERCGITASIHDNLSKR